MTTSSWGKGGGWGCKLSRHVNYLVADCILDASIIEAYPLEESRRPPWTKVNQMYFMLIPLGRWL
jgi:hypothetical protein